MVARKVLGLFGVIFWLSGCGGASAEYAAKSGGGYYAPAAESAYGGGNAPSSVSADRSASSPAPAPATESYGGGTEAREPQALNTQQPTERPGLGTGWGESRVSHVHEVAFERSDTRPFAIATLHYNDQRGVQALAAYHQAVSGGGFLHEVPEAGGAITVSIIGQSGSPLDAIKVGDRTFVIGHEGERYSIVMTNHTNHRFESVASVDGLDVVNGRPASFDNRGYLLAPFGRVQIDGFRQSQDAVAAFRFSRVSESYAAQTSGDREVGVIGVAFFAERGDSFDPWSFDELRTRDTASPFPADPRFARPPR